jgi:hypothetical protein
LRRNTYSNYQEFLDDILIDYYGIEFEFHGIYYFISFEGFTLVDNNGNVIQEKPAQGKYAIRKGFNNTDTSSWSWYQTWDELLNQHLIESRPVKEVIMDDETLIIGKS